MGKDTGIQWTDHTFNPWWGCTRVSAGCANCYAASLDERFHGSRPHWGRHEPRKFFGDKHWAQPIAWNKAAERDGVRRRVFCASMADVFEGRDTMPAESWPLVQEARLRLFDVIRTTPHLDWQLLTKRPENILATISRCAEESAVNGQHELAEWLLAWYNGNPPANVWLGTSVEDQKTADTRVSQLLRVAAVVHFLSAEPLLAGVDLTQWMPAKSQQHWTARCRDCGYVCDAEHVHQYSCGDWDEVDCPKCGSDKTHEHLPGRIKWVICGGESGRNARPMHPKWARSLRDQCQAAGVAYFFKQWGAWRPPVEGEEYNTLHGRMAKPPAFVVSQNGTVHCTKGPAGEGAVAMIGCTKAAGRMLDGREWNEFPETP